MSQEALASAAGVTQPVISAYEAGRRQPTVPTLLHLLQAAGFDLTCQLVEAPAPVLALARAREYVLAEAARHSAERVRVFGSVARGDATADSDIDLLVRFRPGTTLLTHVRLQAALEKALGVPVDIVSEGGLTNGDPIAKEAVPL
jgi:predicted nucleotidyltransferase